MDEFLSPDGWRAIGLVMTALFLLQLYLAFNR